MIGTGASRYTTAPNLCHVKVTLESLVDHTPDRALPFISLDLGQTRGAASLFSMLSHTHVRSISLDVTPPPLTLTLTLTLMSAPARCYVWCTARGGRSHAFLVYLQHY